ncbi:MAG: gluconokinase [Anaerolineales bacterium]
MTVHIRMDRKRARQSRPGPLILILMGVSGVGKTTVGKILAKKLACSFYDADDFHPPSNLSKMRAGTSLTDADREPWLELLHALLSELEVQGESAVLACSALKESHREKLTLGLRGIRFVFLRADYDQLRERLAQRKDHFMPLALLESQLADLEEPVGAVVVDAGPAAPVVAAEVVRQLDLEVA